MKSQRVVVAETAEGLKISGGGGTNNNRNLFDAKSLQRRVAYSLSICNRPHPLAKMAVFLIIYSQFSAININIRSEPQLVQKLCHKTQMGWLLKLSQNKKDLNDVTAALYLVCFLLLAAEKKTPKWGSCDVIKVLLST